MSRKCNRRCRTREAIQFRSLELLRNWTMKRMVSHVLEQMKRSMGSHRLEIDTEVWRKFILLCWSILEIPSPRRAKRECTFGVRLTQRQSLFTRTVTCNQLCIYAAVCVCCLTSTIKTMKHEEAHYREGSYPATDDLTNLTHWNVLTASGHRARDSENRKTFSKVPAQTSFVSRSWPKPILSDQTLKKQCRKMDTSAQRRHTTSQ